MLESSNNHRVKFPKNKQKEWIKNLRKDILLSDIAKTCSCSERTIRDWQRERFLMDYSCLVSLCDKLKLKMPDIVLIPRSENARKAGKKGGQKTLELYGGVVVSEEKRKEKWNEWWEAVGRHNKQSITAPKKSLAFS